MTKALFLPLALILAVLTTVAEAAPFRPSPALEPAPMVTLTGSRVFTTILSKVEQSAPRMPLSLARLARGEQGTPSVGRSAEVCLVSSERNQEDEEDLTSPDGYTAPPTGGGY